MNRWIDALPHLVWLAEPDGRFADVNVRWVTYTGLGKAESAGWGWREALDAASLREFMDRWVTALREGCDFEVYLPLRRHDGRFRMHLFRAAPVHSEEGRVASWVGTATEGTRSPVNLSRPPARSGDDDDVLPPADGQPAGELRRHVRRTASLIASITQNLSQLTDAMRDLSPESDEPKVRSPRRSGMIESPLSERELQILQMMANGESNAAIAERLHFGVGTIKLHVREILEKLDAKDRTEAAVQAVRRGLI